MQGFGSTATEVVKRNDSNSQQQGYARASALPEPQQAMPSYSSLVIVGSVLEDIKQQEPRTSVHAWLGQQGSSIARPYQLPPLKPDDIEMMAKGLLGCSGLTPELANMISCKNPFANCPPPSRISIACPSV